MRFCLFLALLAALTPQKGRVVRVASYRELRDACQTARPGDTILLAPGVYTIEGATRIAVTGRPGPVVVRSETGDPASVVVRGHGQDDPSVEVAFDLTDCPHWTFAALTTRDTYDHGFKFNGSSTDCALRGVVMRDHGESGVKGTCETGSDRHPDRLTIEGCDIGFDKGQGGTRPVVEGIDGVGVVGWRVAHCRFVNVHRAEGVAYGVFTKGNSSGTVIEACRFEGCDIGASFGGGGTGRPFFRGGDTAFEQRGGTIRNNVFVRCHDAGIYLNRAADCRVDHNTLFECALTIQLRYPQTSARVRNNLVVPSAGVNEPVVRLRDDGKTLESRGNLLGLPEDLRRPLGLDHEVDASLKAGAPEIDTGVDLGRDVPTDFDGAPRPQGRGYDVGAFESPTKK